MHRESMRRRSAGHTLKDEKNITFAVAHPIRGATTVVAMCLQLFSVAIKTNPAKQLARIKNNNQFKQNSEARTPTAPREGTPSGRLRATRVRRRNIDLLLQRT